MKNPLTPDGIEPATSRFVAEHLNHCATAVPIDRVTGDIITVGKNLLKERQDLYEISSG